MIYSGEKQLDLIIAISADIEMRSRQNKRSYLTSKHGKYFSVPKPMRKFSHYRLYSTKLVLQISR